jgi:hypothetical protein
MNDGMKCANLHPVLQAKKKKKKNNKKKKKKKRD